MNVHISILVFMLACMMTIAFPVSVLAATGDGNQSAGESVSLMEEGSIQPSSRVVYQETGNLSHSPVLMPNSTDPIPRHETDTASGSQDPSFEESTNPQASGRSVVDITGINAQNFPYILTYVTVDTTAGRTGQLSEDEFQVFEDGNQMDITLIPFSDSSTQTKLDLVILFDDTGSMGDKISDIKEKVTDLTNSITSANIDCRYSLISFKDTVSVQQRWTSDPTVIKNAVDGLIASGGDDAPEANLDAIETALSMDFRSDAQRMILDITDEKTHYRDDGTIYSGYTIPETASHLLNNGISYILVGPMSVEGPFNSHNDKRELVKSLGGNGLFFDIQSSDFSVILDNILAIITQTYTIGYVTPRDSPDGSPNRVQVIVGTDTDQGQYSASETEKPVLSGGITPNMTKQGSTIPVTLTGKNFKSGANIRLFQNSYVINLSESSITPSFISGLFIIPSDAPTGLYNIEIINPKEKIGSGYNVFEIIPSRSPVPPDSSLSGDYGMIDDQYTAGLTEEGNVMATDCEGWEVNSGYYLESRYKDTKVPVETEPDPWCWCHGSPYNKNHQLCLPV
jgi:hypothetical protein